MMRQTMLAFACLGRPRSSKSMHRRDTCLKYTFQRQAAYHVLILVQECQQTQVSTSPSERPVDAFSKRMLHT